MRPSAAGAMWVHALIVVYSPAKCATGERSMRSTIALLI